MPPVRAGNRLELALPGSSWSTGLQLEAVGTHGLVELAPSRATHGERGPRSYQLGVSIALCPGGFGRSKLLLVDHRVTLLNSLTRPLGFKQFDAAASGEVLLPGERAPFHWQDARRQRLLSVCLLADAGNWLAFSEADWSHALSQCDWSNALPIEDVGEFTVVCRLPNERTTVFVGVDVQMHGAAMRVVLSEQPPTLAPYRIENACSFPLLVSQTPCAALQQPRVISEVPPCGTLPFAWEQLVTHPTLDLHVGQQRRQICLDDLQLRGTIEAAQTAPPRYSPAVRFRVIADGPTKVRMPPATPHLPVSTHARVAPGAACSAAPAEPRQLSYAPRVVEFVRRRPAAIQAVDVTRVGRRLSHRLDASGASLR